jgi:oxalate decarboxylase/phosphoglucose isomerase-like protein (cupin superfamily)
MGELAVCSEYVMGPGAMTVNFPSLCEKGSSWMRSQAVNVIHIPMSASHCIVFTGLSFCMGGTRMCQMSVA